jgi:hypothetical protein
MDISVNNIMRQVLHPPTPINMLSPFLRPSRLTHPARLQPFTWAVIILFIPATVSFFR